MVLRTTVVRCVTLVGGRRDACVMAEAGATVWGDGGLSRTLPPDACDFEPWAVLQHVPFEGPGLIAAQAKAHGLDLDRRHLSTGMLSRVW
jgi:hypothetical protein